jgi:Protein of unknown function (DUF3592)
MLRGQIVDFCLGAVVARMSRGQVVGFCFGAIVAMGSAPCSSSMDGSCAARLNAFVGSDARHRLWWWPTSIKKHHLDEESSAYPIVQFQAPDGRLVRARTDFGGDFAPAIGDHVEVLFDPEQPEEAHIESRLSDQVNSLIGVFGAVIIVGAAIAAVIVLVVFREVWL